MMPQHGGKYADHEFVKVASKVIKGVERAPYNKFETVLVNYDKMKEIKGKRNLTKSEQRIYDTTDKLIQKEFDAMFKKADTMLDQLDRKTTAQKGGGSERANILNKINPFKSNNNNKVSPAPAATPASTKEGDPPAGKEGATASTTAATSDATASTADTSDATASTAAPKEGPPSKENPAPGTDSTDTTSAKPKPKEDAAIRRMRDDSTQGSTVTVPEYKKLPPPEQSPPTNPREDEAAPPDDTADTDDTAVTDTSAKDAKKPKENETSFMDSNRFYRWIVSLLKGIWEWIKGLFTGAFSDKLERLRTQFSADELFKLFGPNPEKKIEEATGVFQEQAEKLQRLVATGIGGAASASIDMILNAFSMSPVFGTTILVWRMFQNMLMIMGASLSVQAASNSTSTTLATIADPKLAGGGKANAKNNVTKRLKTDIRQLNRSLKRYMHFPHKGPTMSGGLGSGYSYT